MADAVEIAYTDPKTGLARDDMALCTNVGSPKGHIVTLQRRPYPLEISKGGRAYLWQGHPLCDGNFHYYWHFSPEEDHKNQRCVRCFQRWRALGKPAVKGILVETIDVPNDPIPNLPIAWAEVVPDGLESDEKPKKEDGPTLRELRRWRRGSRYVRICEVVYPADTPEDERKYTHSLRHGWVGQPKTDEETFKSSLARCLQDARELMMAGGSPHGGARQIVRNRWY